MEFENIREDGVSPVIGVVLMVAVTVILAALIASFAFGLGGGLLSENPQAAVNFDQSPNTGTGGGANVTMQIVSLENADTVSYSVADNSGDGDSVTGTQITGSNTATEVGDTATVSALEAGDQVTVTATLEGKTQVIQTYEIRSQ